MASRDEGRITPLSRPSAIPVASLVKAERLDAIEQRVRHAGAEVINLLKTGSAHYSPASSALLMAEAYLAGDCGLRDLYVGVSVKIGAG